MKNYLYIKTLIFIGLIFSNAMADDKESGFAGPYLAAKYAISESNFNAASEFYNKVLNKDPTNLILLNEALLSSIGQGDFITAQKISEHYVLMGGDSNVSDMVRNTISISENDYRSVIININQSKSRNPLTDRLVKAWALLGNGEMANAKKEFDQIAENPSFRNQARYHEAMAVAMVGDFEEADEILSGRKYGTVELDNRGLLAFIKILIQVDKKEQALSLINGTVLKGFEPDFVLNNLKDKLMKGSFVDYDFITNPRQGIAEVYLGIVRLLENRVDPTQILLLSRLAEFLWPEDTSTIIQVAKLLEDLQQYELAISSYSSISQNDPNYLLAELGRAKALNFLKRHDASIEVLNSLTKSHKDHTIIYSALGDTYRRLDRNTEAIEAYSKVINLSQKFGKERWVTYFYRGMVFEKQKKYNEMERDFFKALELSPKQPDVLNFLGYSLVEQRRKFPEALRMIKTAAEERPDNGYIIDSLGWIYYRLGNYQEAVQPMEKAVNLLPVDPIVNDHLGDVYWMVGRIREANFQWKRSLSFSPNEGDAKRIRQKLKLGLDKVLENEKLIETKTAKD